MDNIKLNNGPMSQEEMKAITENFTSGSLIATKLSMLRLGTYYGILFGEKLKENNIAELMKVNNDPTIFCLFLRSLLEGVFNEIFQDSNSKVDIEIESSLINNPAEFSFTSRKLK